MKKSVWLFLVAGALLSALALTACGDDDGAQSPAATTNGAGAGTGTPASTTSPGSAGNDQTPPAAGGGTRVDVQAKDFAFNPAEISVPAGEPITFKFTNEDSIAHTFTLYTDEGFTHAIDGGSASASTPEITVALVAPGNYYFRCEIHKSQMQGVLKAE